MGGAQDTVAASGASRRPGDPLELLVDHARRLVRVDCAVLLTVGEDDDGPPRRAAEWFASERLEQAVGPLLDGGCDTAGIDLVDAALHRGRPLFLPRLEGWEAAEHLHRCLQEDALWEIVRRASVIACPVRTMVGRPLGALIAISVNPDQPLRTSDLDLVVVLADLAALAHERSELLGAEAARARDEALLKRAAEDISGSLEAEKVQQRIATHALSVGDGTHASLSLINTASERIAPVAEAGEEAGHATDTLSAAVAETARTRVPVIHSTPDPVLHVPVSLGPRLFGVLSVTRRGGPEFDHDDTARLTRLAHTSAAAITNALDFQRERTVATALTRGFIPESLPNIPGWDVGLLYEPAQHQPTGGDIYGAWPLGDGQIALLIGDVTGKGVETAAMSAMARYFIEAYSRGSSGPAEVLQRANSMLQARLPQETFVTAFLGFLDRRGIRYANAGHLAPLLLRTGGELLEVSGGELPLGIDDDPPYAEREVALARGDLLLAFTDGIIEARRSGELLGIERLREMLHRVATATDDPQETARLLHAEVDGWSSGLSDDAAILALRRKGLQLID